MSFHTFHMCHRGDGRLEGEDVERDPMAAGQERAEGSTFADEILPGADVGSFTTASAGIDAGSQFVVLNGRFRFMTINADGAPPPGIAGNDNGAGPAAGAVK